MEEDTKEYLLDKLKYLDTDYDLDLIIPGPNRDERNKSRLDSIITGKQRPADHLWKEAQINSYGNVGIPLLLAFMNYARKSGKALKGAKIISESATPEEVATENFGPAINRAQKQAGENLVKAKTNLKLARKERKANEPKNILSKVFYYANGGMDPFEERVAYEMADRNAASIDTAAKIITSNPPGRLGDAIENAAGKSAEKTALRTVAAKGAGKAAKDAATNKKDGYDKGIDGFDDRIEMGIASKAMHFLKSLTGADELDPSIWPMDAIDNLITQTNGDLDLWDNEQLKALDNKEKVRLVMDIARGKYDTDDYDVKNTLLKNYLELTEGNED